MKKIFCFLAVAGTALFTSCNNDDDNNNNDATSITISSDNSTIALGDEFTFTVRDNNNDVVTDDATIYVNDVEIEGNTFEPTEVDTYTVYATMGDLESQPITVTVTENPATSITVSVSSTSVGVGEEITFTAVTNDGVTVTDDATFSVNGVDVEGNTFSSNEAGEFSVVAEYMDLTSLPVTFEVTEDAEEASDSFIIDGENFETPVAAFGYRGIFETEEGSEEYIIVYDFNPYMQEGTSNVYPNDLYITIAMPITPTGVNEDGDPTFTIVEPTENSYTLDATDYPAVIDAIIIAGGDEYLPTNAAERAELLQNITLNISDLQFAENENDTSNLEATYTITLTDGTAITGEYSGETGIYDLPNGGGAAGRGVNLKNIPFNKSEVKTLTKK